MSDPYERLEFVPGDYFARVDPGAIFPAPTSLELDLGCGDGTFLLEMARHYTDRQFLGTERLLGRVRKVCRRADREGLENVRVLRLDTAYAVRWLLPQGAFARIHLLFPDPWPKKKHHKRRMVQTPFLEDVRALLQPGGEFLFKTDHPDYFEQASECIAAFPGLEALPWEEDALFYPETDFERLWKGEGKPIHRVRLCKPED